MLCVGFLRGINVGGKNKVPMDDLKKMFADFGCGTVTTVGNTGCIIYDSDECLFDAFVTKRLNKTLDKNIPYVSIPFDFYKRALNEAPEWWGENYEWRHNVVFLTGNYSIEKALMEIGETNPAYDRVYSRYGMIFWSSAFKDDKKYRKTQYSKLTKKDAYQYFTIRNVNTAKKVLEEAEKMNSI